MDWLRRQLVRHRIHLALFALGALVFAAVSGSRIAHQSRDPHFVLQADAWLDGRLSIPADKWRGDDPAKVETVTLADGSSARGRRMMTRPTFRVAGGQEIPRSQIRGSQGFTHHVSFPPLPAVLMLPQTAIFGHRANDVLTTVLIAALVLPLFFATLRRLARDGLSERGVGDDIWLTLALCFGTVFFFSAVQGRVWFTAHVIGVALAVGYAYFGVAARRPVLAGLCLGLAAITRAPMAFMFPLFFFEAWRVSGGRAGWRAFVGRAALFAAPIVVIAVLAMIHNYLRFAEPLEFGHRYLAVKQQQQIETVGMFSYDYLSRNLAVALTLLPDISSHAPYLRISGHGLALWLTSPFLLLLLWPRTRGPLHRALWITVACVAVPSLLYQNSGWVQFGYRFSLDYTVLLLLLIAVGGRAITRWVKGLIIAALIINLFGAWSFDRKPQYYRLDAATYNTVIKH